MSRSITNNRLGIIEAKIVALRTRAEEGKTSAKEIIWELAELEKMVRNTHADLIAQEGS